MDTITISLDLARKIDNLLEEYQHYVQWQRHEGSPWADGAMKAIGDARVPLMMKIEPNHPFWRR
jgi:hypothetical protein